MPLPRCLLWLDDLREPPLAFEGRTEVIWCKNVEDAIDALGEYPFDLLSLDHDLGYGVSSGADFAALIEDGAQLGCLRPVQLQIHSANPVGRKAMLAACRNAYAAWGWTDREPRVIYDFISYCQEVREMR